MSNSQSPNDAQSDPIIGEAKPTTSYGGVQGGVHNYAGVGGDVNITYHTAPPPGIAFVGVPPCLPAVW